MRPFLDRIASLPEDCRHSNLWTGAEPACTIVHELAFTCREAADSMIRFTPQQHDELPKEPASITRAVDPCSNLEYVLMRSDLYERLLASLAVDSAALMNEVMAEDDAHDPYLESYQRAAKDCA